MQKNKIQNTIVLVVSYLYIFLFVYAAMSKLLDFENFQVQLGQSPLFSGYAPVIALLVPLFEFLIVGLLIIPLLRFKGMLLAYIMMTMFTVYIYLILNYSSFIPCSCGGILEKMNWTEHLWFNVIFMLLGILGLLCFTTFKYTYTRKLIMIGIGTVIGIAVVLILYFMSEHKMKYDNGFVRRFPQHSAQEIHQMDLEYNSYYFAGIHGGKIYLGNYTAPLLITILDTAMQTQETRKIELFEKHLPFRRPTISVFNDDFYVYEGAVPYIFKGAIQNWKAYLKLHSGLKFSKFEPIDRNHIALRYSDSITAQNLIGTINLVDTTKVVTNVQLLEKQIDGIFDTDGSLHVDHISQKLVYIYLYRNQYILTDKDLKMIAKGNTIDTVRTARLSIREVKSHGIHTFSSPPLIVNKTSSVDFGYLYVNSYLRGKYESDYIWNHSSIIDVYNLKEQSYQYSLTINAIGNKKLKSFVVKKDRLYALIGTKIIAFKLIDYQDSEVE